MSGVRANITFHRVDMTKFCAINRPSDSPLKPSPRKQPPLHAVSQQKCAMDQGQPSARPSVVVPLPEKQNRSQPKDKGDLREAIAKAKRTSQKPRKKKQSSASSTSKPRRQQAAREKKLIPSIEQSPNIVTGSSTPENSTDVAGDSDFVPSPADLAEMSQSSTPSTPSRRSPRKHPSRCPNAGLSPEAGSALAVGKRESSPTRAPTVTARSPSPSIWSSPLRRKRIEEDGFAELPKVVYKYEKAKLKLEVREKIMIAGKRKEKGKFPEQRSVEETYESTKKTKKRSSEDEAEQNEPRKRQKQQKLRKPGLDDHRIADEGRTFGEEPSVSKQINARRSPKGKTKMKGQEHEGVEVKAHDSADTHGVRSYVGIEAKGRPSGGSENQRAQCSVGAISKSHVSSLHEKSSGHQASRNSGRQKRHQNEGGPEHLRRREISVPDSDQHCLCSGLPEYFTRDPSCVPCLETWKECRLEFFLHLKQICSCPGSNHPKHVVDACRKILERNDYPSCWDNGPIEPVCKYAQEDLTTSGTKDSNLKRGMRDQSSIAPWIFYGNASGNPATTDTGSSLRPVPQSPKEVNNGCMPSKALPVRNRGQPPTTHDGAMSDQLSNSAVPTDPCSYLTPPNSSPLGQRRKTSTSSHYHPSSNSPTGQENVGVRRILKPLPEVSSGLDRPQNPFENQRQRHQSMPVNFLSRNTIVEERNLLPPSASQRRNNALQDITNSAIFLNMDRRITSLAEEIRQVAAVQPAQAPTAAPTNTTTAQGGDRADHPPARRKSKRPSHAERRLKNPKLDRNVPAHLRLTDDQVVGVGRIVNPYERHVKAPQAFGRNGRLYSAYKHLATRSFNGWTADEICRNMK